MVKNIIDATKLGRYYLEEKAVHPSYFSQMISEKIVNFIYAFVFLNQEKLVLCDLDNTLWEGVIGEGQGIKHYLDRQSILNTLKSKGIVLAITQRMTLTILSGNGGILNKDLLLSHIGWNPKVQE